MSGSSSSSSGSQSRHRPGTSGAYRQNPRGWRSGSRYRPRYLPTHELEIPSYQQDLGRDIANLGVSLPSLYSDVSSQIRPGSPDPDVPIRVTLEDYLKTLTAPWSSTKPPAQRIYLLRDLILQVYNHLRTVEGETNSSSGYFRLEDVEICDGETTILRFHKSRRNLGYSLEVATNKILEVPPAFQDDFSTNAMYIDFKTRLRSSVTAMELAMMYYHPFIRFKKEIIYFLLDVALLADLDFDVSLALWKPLGMTIETVVDKIDGIKYLTGKDYVFKNTYEGALDIAKMMAHHYNEILQTNLSLEQVMDKYFIGFPDMPLQLFCVLVERSIDFRVFMED